MLALTLWRPWDASMLGWRRPDGEFVAGPKDIENRDWPPPRRVIGADIAFHAGQRYDVDGVATMRRLGFDPPTDAEGSPGHVVGVVRVVRAIDVQHFALGEPLRADPWLFGRYGWVVDHKRLLPTPVRCRGAQGLWSLPPDVEAAVRAQLRQEMR